LFAKQFDFADGILVAPYKGAASTISRPGPGSLSIFKIDTVTPGKLVSAGATNTSTSPDDVVIAP